MYKITFNIQGQMSFIDLPQFDSLLAYCYAKELQGDNFQQKLSISKEEMIDFSNLPVLKDKNNLFKASQMFFEKEKHVEWVSSWKKRWDNVNDDLVDFGKNKKYIQINRGDFKSYDVPLVLNYVDKVWFYFESENLEQVERLIKKHLFAIGKKQSQGFGIIKDYVIEQETERSFELEILRPIPKELVTPEQIKSVEGTEKKITFKFSGYRPPYWAFENMKVCAIVI